MVQKDLKYFEIKPITVKKGQDLKILTFADVYCVPKTFFQLIVEAAKLPQNISSELREQFDDSLQS